MSLLKVKKNGKWEIVGKGLQGENGKDYVLTEEDKTEIAEEAAELVDIEAIIDVTALPTENINDKAFYRLLTGSAVFNQYVQTMYNVYCVETLPETGKPATNIDQTEGNVYYNLADGNAYGYVDDMLSMGLGVPSGWYPGDVLLGALGYGYSGIITDILDDPMDNTFRILLKYVTYSYKDGEWTSYEVIGWRGTGKSAEIFNHPSNEASGDCSHAEGSYTIASGHHSHAEGRYTIASGENQHVQGKYNAEDTANKYAHIVGNGEWNARSNAHTIDWNGNAWFQGKVKVGGTGQDDEKAKELATTEYVDAKVPNCDENNNGQFLMVVNGVPTWTTLPNAEGVSF